MNAEDNLKIQLRNDLRHGAYSLTSITRSPSGTIELNVRLKDQAFEQIVAPPAAGHAGLAQIGQRRDPDDEPAEFPELA